MASLSQIKEGDIVEVDVKGRIGLAFAGKREDRRLHIRPITPHFNYFSVTGHQVVRTWRQTKNVRKSSCSIGHDAEVV